jgi:hypothetical protein
MPEGPQDWTQITPQSHGDNASPVLSQMQAQRPMEDPEVLQPSDL